MEVIDGKPEHVFEFAELAKAFVEEGIKDYEWGFNEDDIHATYHLWDEGLRFLLVDKNKVVGILAGLCAPHFFNYKNIYFQEVMWFVQPEYRTKGGGLLLYNACVKRCKERGVTRMVMGHTKHMEDKFTKLYEKLGFTFLESHYEKVI